MRHEQIFPLKRINLDYVRGAKRFPMLYIFPGLVAAAALGFMSLILSQDTVPHNVVMYPAMFLISGLIGVVRGVPQIEYFQFQDHWRRPLFAIIRERSQAQECDDFVRALIGAIEQAASGEVVKAEKASPISTVCLPNPGDAYFVGEMRWQVALVLGSLAVGVPQIPRLHDALDDLLFFFVFGCCFGGMVFTYLSYQAKERRRHIALIGAALSLASVYLYNGPLN